MQKVIVNIDNPVNVDLFLKMVGQLNFVESVKLEDEGYDWINPSRPATDEECEEMIAECEAEYEAGLYIPIEDARKQTLKEIDEWMKDSEK